MKKMTRKKSKPKRGATKPPMGGLVIGLDGSSVEVDDIFAFVGARMKEADERVLPEQVAIRPGDFAIAGTSGELIFYRILDPLATAHPDELEELRKSYASKPHLRWVEGFSEICPEGELGDVHVSEFSTRISGAQFEALRRAGWPSDTKTAVEVANRAVGAN